MVRVDLDSVLHALNIVEKDLSIEKSLIKFRGLDVYSLGGTPYGLSYNNGSPCILRMDKGRDSVIADSSMFTEDACLFRRFVVAVVNRSKLGEEKNKFTKDNNLNIVMVFLAFRNLKKNAVISSYRFTTPLENENYSRDAKTKGIDYVVVAQKKLDGKEVVFQVTQDGNVRLKSDNSIYASIEDGKSIIDFGREVADITYNYRCVDNSNVLDIISKVIELHNNNDVIRINRKSKFELEVYNAEDLVCKVVYNEYSNSCELRRFSPKGVYSLDLGSLLNDIDIIASEIIRGMTLKDLSGYSKYLVMYILACKFIIGLSTFTVVLSEVSNIKSKWYTSILLDYILDSMYAKVSKFYTKGGTETRINDSSAVMRVATLHNDTNLVEISYTVSANNRHTVKISFNKNTFYSKEGSVFDILDIMYDMDEIVSHIKYDDTDVANSTTQDKEVGVKNMSDSSLTVNEADLFMSLFIDTLSQFSGNTIEEIRDTRNISPEGIKARLDATWLADSDLFYTLFMNGEGDIRIDAVEKDSKRLVNSYSMGVFQDPDVEFFADFCTQFMFSSVKDTHISNKIVYTTYNLISEHISGILGCDKNSVRIDSWTDTEVVYSVSDKAKFRLDLGTHIITYTDNRSVSVSHPLSSDKDEENFIVVIRNRQNELNSMVKHYIPSLVASDKEDNESLVEDEDNIFEGVRIVKLLYNGDVVGFRFKGVNIPGYDVSKETAKKYGVSALKISTAIDLKDHNGLLLSKAEIGTGNMIRDISDNHDLVKQLFDYILGVSK